MSGPRQNSPAFPEPWPGPAADPLLRTLALRERYRNGYWNSHDPILADRLQWRAHSVRHTVHLLPGQTVLELGCGDGQFTRELEAVTQGQNALTAVTFQPAWSEGWQGAERTERIRVEALPGPLAGRSFDCIVAMDLLDVRNSSEVLSILFGLLSPGGEIVLYESNPWNPVHKIRYSWSRLVGRPDPRALLSRPRLYELLSEIGFIRVYAVYNDFVFAPLTRALIWWLRNLSILLENAPVASRMAGSILLHAQKPPREKRLPDVSFRAPPVLRRAVSFVIPCYNEEMNVEPLVAALLRLYGDFVHEVVLVNDNSTDRTGWVIDRLAEREPRVRPLHRTPPNGVGRAIAAGIGAATGGYVLTMDCDFQHLLPELRDLFAHAENGYDVVIGSRFSRHSVLLNYPFAKIVANRAFHALARLCLGRNVRDVTNNLKLMRREAVQCLRLTQPGFAINAETGLQPYLFGLRVKEVPISWINRTPGMGTSSFRLVKVGGGYGRVLWEAAKYRFFRRGAYGEKTQAAHHEQ